MNDPSQGSSESQAAPPRRRSKSRRILRIGGLLGVLLVALILLAPTLLSTGWARRGISDSLGDSLGVSVDIGELGLGWFSGARVAGLRIAQPPGFEGHEPLFELASFEGGVSLAAALRGRIDVSGLFEGMRLRVVEDESGNTNLEALGPRGRVVVEPGEGEPREPGDSGDLAGFLGDVRLDVELRDAEVLIVREPQGTLEHLDGVHLRVTKPYGTSAVHLALEADLRGAGEGATPGKLNISADVDAEPGTPIDAVLTCTSLHLERYRPLLNSFAEPGAVQAFGGTVDANVRVHGRPDDEITVRGRLNMAEPRFAGPLFADMDVRSAEWELKPDVTLAFGAAEGETAGGGEGGLPRIDLSALRADFGFAQVAGLPDDETGRSGLRFDVDVDALAAFGGPLPELLQGSGARTHGELRVPLRADFDRLGLGELLGVVGADLRVELRQLDIAGQSVRDLGARLALDGGAAELTTTGGQFAGGALELQLRSADVTRLAASQVELIAGLQAGAVGGGAVEGLRYAVPLLAGLNDVPASQRLFESKLDFGVDLSGPLAPATDQSVLAWLDGWSGAGNLRLFDGRLAPAPRLQGLLKLVQPVAGQAVAAAADKSTSSALLSFDEIATDFRLDQGAVQNRLMQLAVAGHQIGIRGETRLSGAIDYVIDASSLLAEHRDGRKVLELLGDDFTLGAELAGTLDEPRLQLPDVRQVIEQSLQDLVRKRGSDLLQDVLGGDGDGAKQDPGEAVRDATDKLLRGVFGGRDSPPGTKPKRDGGDGDGEQSGGEQSGGEKSGDGSTGSPTPQERASKQLENVLRGVLGGGN